MHICVGLAFLHVFLSSEGISHCLSFNETLCVFVSDMALGKTLLTIHAFLETSFMSGHAGVLHLLYM